MSMSILCCEFLYPINPLILKICTFFDFFDIEIEVLFLCRISTTFAAKIYCASAAPFVRPIVFLILRDKKIRVIGYLIANLNDFSLAVVSAQWFFKEFVVSHTCIWQHSADYKCCCFMTIGARLNGSLGLETGITHNSRFTIQRR